MQFFEILCILLGIVNGALLPMLPSHTDQRRPIGAVLGLSVAFALLTGFLPVIVSSPRFVSTLVITLIGAGVGFFGMASVKAPREQKRPAPSTATAEVV